MSKISSTHPIYKRNILQQNRGFYYTVRCGSVSKAAELLNLTQATISLQIQSLERDLKTKLFKRNSRPLKLTKDGERFYKISCPAIQQLEGIIDEFNKSKETKTIIDIASNHAAISYILPKYLKEFVKENPEATFKIRNLSKKECLRRIINDEIDICLYSMNYGEVPKELKFIPIAQYQPILLTNKNHSLAKKKDFNLKDVKPFNLVRIDPHLVTLPSFEEIIKSHGLKTNIEFEMSDWEILKRFVEADIGVAIISNIILEGDSKNNLVGRSLAKYFPEINYGILIKRGKILNNSTQDFIDFMQNKKLLKSHIENLSEENF